MSVEGFLNAAALRGQDTVAVLQQLVKSGNLFLDRVRPELGLSYPPLDRQPPLLDSPALLPPVCFCLLAALLTHLRRRQPLVLRRRQLRCPLRLLLLLNASLSGAFLVPTLLSRLLFQPGGYPALFSRELLPGTLLRPLTLQLGLLMRGIHLSN